MRRAPGERDLGMGRIIPNVDKGLQKQDKPQLEVLDGGKTEEEEWYQAIGKAQKRELRLKEMRELETALKQIDQAREDKEWKTKAQQAHQVADFEEWRKEPMRVINLQKEALGRLEERTELGIGNLPQRVEAVTKYFDAQLEQYRKDQNGQNKLEFTEGELQKIATLEGEKKAFLREFADISQPITATSEDPDIDMDFGEGEELSGADTSERKVSTDATLQDIQAKGRQLETFLQRLAQKEAEFGIVQAKDSWQEAKKAAPMKQEFATWKEQEQKRAVREHTMEQFKVEEPPSQPAPKKGLLQKFFGLFGKK